MSELTIRTSRGQYDVRIGTDLLTQLPNPGLVLADHVIAPRVSSIQAPLMTIDASESHKNLTQCEAILRRMREVGCVRESMLIAIGGGMVQDVATLTASLYMRGVPWTYVPTTFMAMADSCIGGKSSINVGEMKNLVGNIYPPTLVLVDLSFTSSLTPAAIASGMAEAIKICFAKGPESFERFVDLRAQAADLSGVEGAALVEHVLRSKQWFVENDEFDRGPRRLLNFGHTFAHALESATGFAVSHGIAVGIGVLAALEHPAARLTGIESDLARETEAILSAAEHDLHRAVAAFDPHAFATAVQSDKKHSRSAYRLILPRAGTLAEVELPRSQESLDGITAGMERVLDRMGG